MLETDGGVREQAWPHRLRAALTGYPWGPGPCTRPRGQAHLFIQQTYMGIAGCEVLCRAWEMTEPDSACLALDEFLENSRVWPCGP